MSALSTADLSALMRTCRYLSEAALLSLCARSYTRLDTRERVASFHQFLRINSGPSSRTPYIKALWLNAPYEPCYSDQETSMYLGILRHCKNLRRLRLRSWYEDIEPTLLFHVIATSLPALEELDLFVMPNVTAKDLHKLARLPLRNLHLAGNVEFVPDALSALLPLARTLEEVQLSHITFTRLRAPPGAFPGVKVLSLHLDISTSFAETLTATFPNITHLRMMNNDMLVPGRPAIARTLREPNKQRWPKGQRPLRALWATDIFELHASGFARHAAHLSVPIHFHTSSTHRLMLLDILADVRPRSLEVRIDMIGFLNRPPHAEFLATLEATLESSARLTLRFDTFGAQSYDGTATALLLVRPPCSNCVCVHLTEPGAQDAVESYLPKNASLTHLLLRHVDYKGKVSQPELARIPALAKASKTMRWIGTEVNGVLRCWTVTRPRQGESADKTPQEIILVEMNEEAGIQVLANEQMDEFR